jgi:transposase InsO family protein
MPKMEKYSIISRFTQLIIEDPRDSMQIIAENILNPQRYHLSDEAKKRLRWMYIIHYKCNGNIAKAARQIGKSRTWLSIIHSDWEFHKRDPQSLEPESKAPHDTSKRKRIAKEKETKIIELRNSYHWGKDKLAVVMKRDYKMEIGATTVNRYLTKHDLIDVKLSYKNKMAHKNKVEQTQKVRPPSQIKDYKPGALIEKDMKFISKKGCFINMEKRKAKENFYLQHTTIDSFTRVRVLGLSENSEAATAVAVQKKNISRFPFPIACMNTDNGSENEGEFNQHLKDSDIVHFFSRSATPTDNPRVERSHLSDDKEFYNWGNVHDTFAEQEAATLKREHIYNFVRPHQALGNLTPMEFYELWKKDSEAAYVIVKKYRQYLKKQSARLAVARKMKKKEEIEQLMAQIDRKLTNNFN